MLLGCLQKYYTNRGSIPLSPCVVSANVKDSAENLSHVETTLVCGCEFGDNFLT